MVKHQPFNMHQRRPFEMSALIDSPASSTEPRWAAASRQASNPVTACFAWALVPSALRAEIGRLAAIPSQHELLSLIHTIKDFG
jgi:hypothetical protein